MTIKFCQKYKSVFLTKGKSFFSCLAANIIFRWCLDSPLCYNDPIDSLIQVSFGIRYGFCQRSPFSFSLQIVRRPVHRESVINDWLLRFDTIPTAERLQADDVSLVAAKEEGRGAFGIPCG